MTDKQASQAAIVAANEATLSHCGTCDFKPNSMTHEFWLSVFTTVYLKLRALEVY